MRLLSNLLMVAGIASFLAGLLAWVWLGEARHIATGAFAALVLMLLSAVLFTEHRRREIQRG